MTEIDLRELDLEEIDLTNIGFLRSTKTRPTKIIVNIKQEPPISFVFKADFHTIGIFDFTAYKSTLKQMRDYFNDSGLEEITNDKGLSLLQRGYNIMNYTRSELTTKAKIRLKQLSVMEQLPTEKLFDCYACGADLNKQDASAIISHIRRFNQTKYFPIRLKENYLCNSCKEDHKIYSPTAAVKSVIQRQWKSGWTNVKEELESVHNICNEFWDKMEDGSYEQQKEMFRAQGEKGFFHDPFDILDLIYDYSLTPERYDDYFDLLLEFEDKWNIPFRRSYTIYTFRILKLGMVLNRLDEVDSLLHYFEENPPMISIYYQIITLLFY